MTPFCFSCKNREIMDLNDDPQNTGYFGTILKTSAVRSKKRFLTWKLSTDPWISRSREFNHGVQPEVNTRTTATNQARGIERLQLPGIYCADAIFHESDIKFNDFIPGHSASHRFQQTGVVNIPSIPCRSEDLIIE